MKKTVLLLLMLIPLISEARFGWRFKCFSLLTGQDYRINQRPLWSFNLQYDRFTHNCRGSSRYFGMGVGVAMNSLTKEFEVNTSWNPTRKNLIISRTTQFFPYLLVKGSLATTQFYDQFSGKELPQQGYFIKPGLGLIGNIFNHRLISIRTGVQAGYSIPVYGNSNLSNPFFIEWKFGIALNTTRIRKKNPEQPVDIRQH